MSTATITPPMSDMWLQEIARQATITNVLLIALLTERIGSDSKEMNEVAETVESISARYQL